MTSQQTPAILVARFLKAHHYTKTLEIFLKEANLSESVSTTSSGDWTIEKLVEEKIEFDASLNFERNDNSTARGWTRPAPSIPREPKCPINTNVLCITGDSTSDMVAITTADNSCSILSAASNTSNSSLVTVKADGPILSTKFLQSGKYLLATSMSGKIMFFDVLNQSLFCERRDHLKWVVNVAYHIFVEYGIYLIATAGWDQKIHLYAISSDSQSPVAFKEIPPPIHTISVASNPEAMVFVKNPDTDQMFLVFTRRDSTFLYYQRIEISAGSPPQIKVVDNGRQNLAPHSNAWVAFTPCALAIHPNDPTLLAISTSHLPHLKVILVRLLFPTGNSLGILDPTTATPASMARADLALQDREDAAITLQVSTQAPQTPYSTPQIAWRPDGSGLWVNGDDGVVRGVEAKTGKVVALLQSHEAGSKVRTLWAGYLGQDEHKMECVISGGFDRKVFMWEIEPAS